MKKMEFMRYAATEIAAYCGDLYKTGKITNFTTKFEYSRILVRTKMRHGIADGTLELVFYSSGKIAVKGYSFDGFKFDMLYYDWTEDTANEKIVEKLKTNLESALSAVIFHDTENCFHSAGRQED